MNDEVGKIWKKIETKAEFIGNFIAASCLLSDSEFPCLSSLVAITFWILFRRNLFKSLSASCLYFRGFPAGILPLNRSPLAPTNFLHTSRS